MGKPHAPGGNLKQLRLFSGYRNSSFSILELSGPVLDTWILCCLWQHLHNTLWKEIGKQEEAAGVVLPAHKAFSHSLGVTDLLKSQS